MGRMAAYLFCVLSLAGFSAIPVASEEAKAPAPTISPWTKFCFNEMCFIGSDIKTECEIVVAAALIEQSPSLRSLLSERLFGDL
jgi:hypothetical protein